MNVLEKILEEIEKEKSSYEAEHAWNYSRGLEYAANIIRSYMNDANDDWIPVEDGLPEETTGRYYPKMNVATSYGAVTWGFYRVAEKQWYIYSNIHNEFVEARDKEIVAWRPLPEPYKPKKLQTEEKPVQ